MNHATNLESLQKDPREVVELSTQQLIELIVKSLVKYPEDISVSFTRGEKTTIYNVNCTQRVIGSILGLKGKTIDGIRNIVSAVCGLHGFRAIIEVPYYPPNK